jgi:hypothetical protein
MITDSILFLSYTVIFWILSYLVIRKSKSPANLLFSSSTFFFGLGTIFSAIGHGFDSFLFEIQIAGYKIVFNYLTFFAIAASLIMIAPLGIFFSGRVILRGNTGYKDESAMYIFFLFLLLGIINLFIYPTLSLKENFMLEDVLTIFILIISFIIYAILYQEIKDYRRNFIFILVGLLSGILALIIGLILFIFDYNDSAEIMRSMGPFLAVFLVLLAFTNLPQTIRNKNNPGEN